MDYSFIRFTTSLESANSLKDSPLSNIRYNEVIQLLPNEIYLQKTNVPSGITFDGDLQVLVVDCNGKTLADVSNKVGVYEYIDSEGVNQLDIEFHKLEVDFYKKPVHFKLRNIYTDEVFYSNSIFITNFEKEKTTRFDYYNHKKFFGISYDKTNFYQSIRLQLWFDKLEDKTEVSDYYQISNGQTITARPLHSQSEVYKCEFMNNFVFERANIMLLHDIIFVDGVRMTNKTTLKSGDRIQSSNIFRTETSIFKNYKETYEPIANIFEPLKVIDKKPLGKVTLITFANKIVVTFNKNIFVVSNNYITIYDILNNSFFQFLIEQGDVTANIYEKTGINLTNGTYRVEFSAGAFKSGSELSSFESWEFQIVNGDYSNTDYSNNYLIN